MSDAPRAPAAAATVASPAVRAPRREAEALRRRLQELGVLRTDVEVGRDGDDVLFAVADSCGPTLPTEPWRFAPRARRPQDYRELLAGWAPDELAAAPRAFDAIGDIVVVKVPAELAHREGEVGAALLRFHGARAVFHDGGVVGEFRTRALRRIAGTGGSQTELGENGFRFLVDPAAAYFSPRLGGERARVAALVRPGERFVDLFGGVGALAVQAAARGAVAATVDLNPDACRLARENAARNRQDVEVRDGDARAVAATLGPAHRPADRVVMNLPHGAHGFLDVAASLAAPGGVVHVHGILPADRRAAHEAWVLDRLRELGRDASVLGCRVVRHYSAQDDHFVWDLRLGQPR